MNLYFSKRREEKFIKENVCVFVPMYTQAVCKSSKSSNFQPYSKSFDVLENRK